MNPRTLHILRLSLGTTTAVALAYGFAWPLYFVCPVFAMLFLALPMWIGWNKALPLLILLGVSLLMGLVISEFFQKLPLLCILVYGLLFFFIYFMENPPPMASIFMTIGITIVPMLGLSSAMAAHRVAWSLLFDMGVGLTIAWIFHSFFTLPMPPAAAATTKASQLPPVTREERARLALVSTIVALGAVVIFFSFNMLSYTYAMMQICLMADSPSGKTTLAMMKGKAIACLIGGVAIVIVYELLSAVPSYPYLLLFVFCTALLFSMKIYSGSPMAKAWLSGMITFLVLLGTSTMPTKSADINFYMRIAQIIIAGLIAVAGLVLFEHLLRPWRKKTAPAPST